MTPIAENPLVKTVKCCAGIQGHKTNHSLRVITAIRLLHVEIDKQLIMEEMGHKSLDGVRAYKHSSKKQQLWILLSFSIMLHPQPRRSRVISENPYYNIINITTDKD